MIRTLVLFALLIVAALGLGGCDEMDGIVDVNVGIDTSPDLRIQVWDRYLDGPYEGALVQTLLPEGRTDGSHTGSDGWTTQWLLIPRSAGRVQISVSFADRWGNPHTIYRWVNLRRGDTEERVIIDTYAP